MGAAAAVTAGGVGGREEEEVSLGVIMTNTEIIHIFYIISLFNLPFFHIFHICSLFNLPFFQKILKIWKKSKLNSEKIWKI